MRTNENEQLLDRIATLTRERDALRAELRERSVLPASAASFNYGGLSAEAARAFAHFEQTRDWLHDFHEAFETALLRGASRSDALLWAADGRARGRAPSTAAVPGEVSP
jgi:hypothetical protein